MTTGAVKGYFSSPVPTAVAQQGPTSLIGMGTSWVLGGAKKDAVNALKGQIDQVVFSNGPELLIALLPFLKKFDPAKPCTFSTTEIQEFQTYYQALTKEKLKEWDANLVDQKIGDMIEFGKLIPLLSDAGNAGQLKFIHGKGEEICQVLQIIYEKNRGVLVKAEEKVKDLIKQVEALVDDKVKMLTNKPSTFIQALEPHIAALSGAIDREDRNQIKAFAKELEKHLSDIQADPQIVKVTADELGQLFAALKLCQAWLTCEDANLNGMDIAPIRRSVKAVQDVVQNRGGVLHRVEHAANQLVHRVEHLPETLTASVKAAITGQPSSNLPPIVPPAPIANPQPAAAAPQQQQASGDGMSFAGILGSAQVFLTTQLSKLPELVAKQASAFACATLAKAIQMAIDYVKGKPGFETVTQDLTALLAEVNKPDDQRKSLPELIQAFLSKHKDVAIFISGFRVNGPDAPPIPLFSENALKLQETLRRSPQEELPMNVDKAIKTEVNRLGTSITNLVLVSVISQICDFAPDGIDKFSAKLNVEAGRLIEIGEQPGVVADAVKKVFFEQVNQADIHFITKVFIKILYIVLRFFLESPIQSLFTKVMSETNQYIKNQPEQQESKFIELEKVVLNAFDRYLTHYAESMREIAGKEALGTLDSLVTQQLASPKRIQVNGVETAEIDLHHSIGNLLFTALSGSRIFGWIFNKILNRELVHNIVLKISDSLKDNHGYSYAMTKGVNDLLEEVVQVVHSQKPGSDNSDEIQKLLEKISDSKKGKLKAIVDNILNAIQYSRFRTVEALKQAAGHEGIKPSWFNALIAEKMVPEMANLLAVIFHTLLRKDADKIPIRIYEGLRAANRALAGEDEISLNARQTAERRQEELKEELISTVITNAIEGATQQFGDKREEESKKYFDAVQLKLDHLISETKAILGQFDVTSDVSAQCKLSEKLSKLWADSQDQFNVLTSKAGAINVDIATKDELKKRMAELSTYMQKPCLALHSILEVEQELKLYEQIIPDLKGIFNKLDTIQKRATGVVQVAEADECLSLLVELDGNLKNLRQIPHLKDKVIQIGGEQTEISEILRLMRKQKVIMDFAMKQTTGGSLYQQLRNSTGTQHRDFARKLIEDIQKNLPTSTQRDQLIAIVRRMPAHIDRKNKNNAEAVQSLEALDKEYNKVLSEILTSLNVPFRQMISDISQRIPLIKNILGDVEQLKPSFQGDKVATFKERFGNFKTAFGELTNKTQGMMKISPKADFPVDVTLFLSWGKQFATHYTRGYVDEFMGFLNKEYTARSLLNHVVFVPIAEAAQA